MFLALALLAACTQDNTINMAQGAGLGAASGAVVGGPAGALMGGVLGAAFGHIATPGTLP
jgi:hypothetical protein